MPEPNDITPDARNEEAPLELVVLVGVQGSGKTTHYVDHFAATHVHVSKDRMTSSRNKDVLQREMIEKAFREGRSVVVDNTSPKPDDRAPLVALARAHGARAVAIYFETPVKECVERNKRREGKARVPDVVIYVTARKVVPPSVAEGFDEVRIVHCA